MQVYFNVMPFLQLITLFKRDKIINMNPML